MTDLRLIDQLREDARFARTVSLRLYMQGDLGWTERWDIIADDLLRAAEALDRVRSSYALEPESSLGYSPNPTQQGLPPRSKTAVVRPTLTQPYGVRQNRCEP
jgi:hypothetical protein